MTRSFWGWGDEERALGEDERAGLKMLLGAELGLTTFDELPAPSLDAIALRASRIGALAHALPDVLADRVSTSPRDRVSHSLGRAYRDVVRALTGDLRSAVDAVLRPRDEAEVIAALAWCDATGVAAIPFGGGTSTVGGVEARDLDRPAVSIDLAGLGAVLEIDRTSRAARIQGGMFGPAIEAALAPHGLSLRHYPQSFEFSTLGGWIATRSGGHFATVHTHIEDFVEAVRVVTPSGILATRRLPASGAGPSPERFIAGTEGTLGIITEAWMRLQERPRFRASATVRFTSFPAAVSALRALAQSGLNPTNCRLLDAKEARVSGAHDGSRHLVLVAFESHDHPLDPWMDRALVLCRDHGGEVRDGAGRTRQGGEGERAGEAGAWRDTFLRAPYLRDALVRLGLVVDTFETAITWDRFDAFHASVLAATESAAVRVAGKAMVTSRVTHVYPDGAAPYFTVIAPGKRGSQVSMWDEIKHAASEAILEAGGTITHHHAVGRDHREPFAREASPLFLETLRAAKARLDPRGTMNPGALFASEGLRAVR